MNIHLLTKGQSVSLLPSANTKGSLGRVPRVTAWDWKYVVPPQMITQEVICLCLWGERLCEASPNYSCWRPDRGDESLTFGAFIHRFSFQKNLTKTCFFTGF